MSLKTKLAQRKPEFVDLVFCLDRPLVGELEAARREKVKGDDREVVGTNPKVKALEKRVRDASVTIRVSSLDWGKWNELVAAHPPREGKTDEMFDPSTFYEAAAKAGASEVTATSTVPIPDEDWVAFVEGLTDGEYDRLAGAVVQVNRNVAAVSLAPLD